MIARLHERTRADRFQNDVRASRKRRRNYGRYVYLAAVAGLFVYLLNLFVGHYFWLRAEGLVVSGHVVIASPYDVQLTQVAVEPGQRVRTGDLLASVRSPQVIESMAGLTARAAETTAKQAEIAIRLEVADALMKSAHERLAQAEEQLTKITASRFVSDAFVVNVSKERYAALQEKASRQAERKASLEQLEQLRRSQAEARQALENLRVMYNDGRIRAPSDGIVGPEVAVQGDVIKHGDHLMHVYVGRKYAIVYLETGTLYATAVGDRVAVADGFSESGGTVTEILPLSMPLPSEFQKAFRAPTRGQIAKIALDDETVFPLSSKIVITGRGALPSIDDVSRSLKTAATALRTAWQRSFGSAEAAGAGR